MSVFTEANGEVLEKFHGKLVHFIVMSLVELLNPFEIGMRREWSVFIERKFEGLVGAEL